MRVYFKKTFSDCIEMSISQGGGLDDLKLWNHIIYNLTKAITNNKSVQLITETPQKYSFGNYLSNPILAKVDKKKYLYNFVQNIDDGLLLEIVESEEFQRGLLRIVNDESGIVFNTIENIFIANCDNHLAKEDKLPYQVIFCESDGKNLILSKADSIVGFSEQAIKEILTNGIESDIDINFEEIE